MNVTYLLDRMAESFPGRRAMLLPDGGTRNWREVHDRVDRLAAGLRDLGATAGSRIAILALNGPHYLEVAWATARLGAILQTINTRLAPAEIAFQIEDAAPELMLVSDALATLAESAAPDLRKISVDGAGAGTLEDVIASATPITNVVAAAPDDTLALFYTSGTTGVPKGVMITHLNVFSNAAFLIPTVGYSDHDVTLHAAPMFHVSDFCASFAQLMAGGQHAFIPQFRPDLVLESVERYRATNMILVPTMINALVRHPEIGKHDLTSWQFLFYGGSPMPEDTLRRCFEVLPCDLAQGYGQTEATHTICVLTRDDHRRALEEPELMQSCGRPLLGVHMRVVDDRGATLPPGEIGEVAVRAPNVMKGYWSRPEETNEVLKDGWLFTGDLGIMDRDGYLSLVDRKKDMIVSGGENVYSAEVENALASHPAVLESSVIAVPDDNLGEHVHAVVVLTEGALASGDDLQSHCRDSIAGYKIPRSFEFADALPKTAAGKVRKALLREPHWRKSDRRIH